MFRSLIFSSLFVVMLLLTGCSTIPMSTNDSSFKRYKDFDYCKVKAVKQSKNNSCGSACLVSVLNYWDISATEQSILNNYSLPSSRGYSIGELMHVARNEGINAYGFLMNRFPKEQLEEQILKGRPVICAVSFPYHLYFAQDIPIFGGIYRELTWAIGERRPHYVVIFGLDKNSFLAIDPSYGIVALDKNKFYKSWKKSKYAALLCVRKNKFTKM